MGTQTTLLFTLLLATEISFGQAQNISQTQGGLQNEALLFNCLRHGQDCLNSGSCDQGTCRCVSNYTGSSCQYLEEDLCSKPCSNGGRCVTDGLDEVCSCPSVYTGQQCERERVTVECKGLDMYVSLDLGDLNFDGKIYLGKDNTNTECEILQSGHSYYNATFSRDNETCDGFLEYMNTSETGGWTYSKQLTIQFSQFYLDLNDAVLNISCFHTDDITAKVKASVSVVRDRSSIKTAGDAVLESYQPAKMKIEDESFQELISDVSLGDRLYMTNYLSDITVYKKLSVDSCVVEDKDAGKSLAIIEDRCISEDARKVISPDPGFFSTNSSYGVTYDMTVFKLTENTRTLHVSCVVNLCKEDNDTRCQQTIECGNSRSRRSADENNELKVQKTSATITIASTEDVRIITSEDVDGECKPNSTTQISLISLAVVCVFLLLVCLGLVFCVVRNRHSAKGIPPQQNQVTVS